jgi:protein-S-isoprenylcysteine O-methyltransferase Ste14
LVNNETFSEFLFNLHPFLLSSIASVLTIAQIVLAFFLHGNGTEVIKWVGWVCIWLSGIFGVVPIITFRKKGGVPKGESYMKTTKLVDTGIYAIVRHPQGGTAWLLINMGVILIAWHWTSAVLGLSSMVLAYADTYKSDQYCIEKFGVAYKEYQERVPRVNFVSGIIRLVLSQDKESGK